MRPLAFYKKKKKIKKKLQSWVPYDLIFKNSFQFDCEAVKFLLNGVHEEFTPFLLISLWSSQITRQRDFSPYDIS